MALATLFKRLLPGRLVAWVQRKRFRTARPPVGWARFGSLRRTMPISAFWGLDRGTPIDRRYIEDFIARHAGDVRGNVLEVADDRYTARYGGDRVMHSDILHVVAGNPRATIIGDLAEGAGIPDGAFDCVIVTQVINYIADDRAAVRHLHRILRPGGVVLATMPGLAKIDGGDDGRWGDWHRYTLRSARALFAESFGESAVTTAGYGNVLAASAFLMGLAQEDLQPSEIDAHDSLYPVVLAVRAHRPV